ncbi:hypothetical protein HII36_05520 [Nonomuraea sp. NN258]|uniref:hypothetical protein n=1 Tax=Nonomuraea antri TaxID=2730852 RepID=UPI00156810A1|nr:hypothetical protein [Nonomuraea antri]NRQ31297.1 hypothetical protein [Nonomuraea antri]
MNDDDFDIEAVAQAARARGYDHMDVLRAQQEAAKAPPPPPTVIPEPEFPYPPQHALGGVVRFRCPFGCPWYHDENPGAEAPGRFMLPADFTQEDVTSAISLEAEARRNALLVRVERAITVHLAVDHPDR